MKDGQSQAAAPSADAAPSLHRLPPLSSPSICWLRKAP